MRALALGLLALAACGGDVHFVEVRLADNLRCESIEALNPRAGIRSVGVEVVRERGDGLEQIPGLDECVEIDRTRNVDGLLAPFQESGVIIEGVPADTRTILRFVGYLQSPDCFRDAEEVCGITCPPVREDELPANGVTVNFVCAPAAGLNQAFLGCLNLETLTEEARANICSPPRE